MPNRTAARIEMDAAVDGRTLCDVFAETAAKFPDRPALRRKDETGQWLTFTWAEYREQVRALALGLRSFGFSRGDFAVILCRNRPEHAIADQGVVHAGGVPVSLYNTLAPKQIAYIAGHCEARVAIVEDGAFLDRLLQVRNELPNLERIIVIEPLGSRGNADVVMFDEVLALGRARHDADPSAFDAMWTQVQPDDLNTLIYTSGTTGPPKGVMNTHRNVLWNLASIGRVMPMDHEDEVISYLPLAHAADRFLTLWQGLARGFTTSYCADIAQVASVLREVRPTFFGAVPRVWEKLCAGIKAAISAEPDDAKRTAILAAIEAGRTASKIRQAGGVVDGALAQTLDTCEPVFAALRAKIGVDRSRIFMTGAAPTPYEVLEFFDAIGVGISEVWGMSELSAIATMNPLDGIRLGTIGKPLPGVVCSIADDGELLVDAGLTMKGYYKEPEMTAETLADGLMHTGDIATIDEEGYVRIVDRKKELIITAGGKNISPANLEGLIKEHPLIGQACVVGDNRAYLAALIVLDGEIAPAWAKSRCLETTDLAELSSHPDVLVEIETAMQRVNSAVSRVENIRRWSVLPQEWTPATDELTPTMKLKRRVIAERYAKEIEALYAE